MSDGGSRKSKRDGLRYGDADDSGFRRPGGDEFGWAVAKIAVAQICQSVGFRSSCEAALDGLSGVLVRYLRDLGKTAAFYAHSAGRTQGNVFDLIQGFEDLGLSHGSETNQCLANSEPVRAVEEYVRSSDDMPFAQPIPRFPVINNQKAIPSFVQMDEMPVGKHIPAWLPAFPDPHTYIHTPVWNERSTDPRAEKLEQARQRRKAEGSLLKLKKRLVSIIPVESLPSGEHGDAAKALQAAESNPFLAAARLEAPVNIEDDAQKFSEVGGNPFLAIPLQPGEKHVSSVVAPAKFAGELAAENQASVLEAFAPVIEAVRSGFIDSGNGGGRDLTSKRPSVHFKFGTVKKSAAHSLDLSQKKLNYCKADKDRDERKKRAELILRKSMENPQELTQL